MQNQVDINRVHPELREALAAMPAGNFTKEGLKNTTRFHGDDGFSTAASGLFGEYLQ